MSVKDEDTKAFELIMPRRRQCEPVRDGIGLVIRASHDI
jgi:hypothetical protein